MLNTVVWVSAALRADHLGCYGARRIRTPTIDGLAASGVRFDQCISAAPRTSLSTTSIATGRYPHRHGVLDWGGDMAPGTETVQGRFARKGYEVASFVFDEGFLFRTAPDAMVRVTHFSPDAPNVDVYVNGTRGGAPPRSADQAHRSDAGSGRPSAR